MYQVSLNKDTRRSKANRVIEYVASCTNLVTDSLLHLKIKSRSFFYTLIQFPDLFLHLLCADIEMFLPGLTSDHTVFTLQR